MKKSFGPELVKYPVFLVDLFGSALSCLALGGDVVFAAFFVLSFAFTTSCFTAGTVDVGMVVLSSSVAFVDAVGALNKQEGG